MSFLIFASLSLLSIGVLYYLFFMRNANPAKEHVEEPEGDDNDQDDQVVGQRGGNNRMANRLRNRRRN